MPSPLNPPNSTAEEVTGAGRNHRRATGKAHNVTQGDSALNLDEDSDSDVLIASKEKERKRKYKSTDDDVEDEDEDDDEEAEVNLESEDEEFMISTANRRTKLKADLTTDDSEEQDSDDASSRNRGRSHQAAKDGEYTLDDSKGIRRSSRSTKFTASLKEPTGESFRYLDVTSSSHTDYNRKSRSRDISRENKTSKKPSVHKNSASQHKAVRRQVSNDVSVSEEDMTGSEDDKDSDEDLKIQRIIASKSERRGVWKELCKKLNTSEIEAGSRWFEDSEDEKLDEDTFEERFLIKWDDLSYLHCSWETQKDLMEQLDNAKAYLKTFFRKSINGFLFTPDERLDGDYFDPSYIQIERILEVEIPENGSSTNKFGIVLDKKNPNYSIGTGRQFLIKWVSLPYSECTYEFERDLIWNDVDYEEQADSFCRRSKKPSRNEIKAFAVEGEREFRRLYMIFGDGCKMEEEKLNHAISSYQKSLVDFVYPNGGQLRDYQAEGVTWMLANYLNCRSSLLADEMGLGKTLQTCAFLSILATKLKRRGPFLVIAPLSTLEHWKREFNSWTSLNTIVYHGTAKNREQTRELEFAFEDDRPPRGGVAFNSSYLKNCHRNEKSKANKLWMVEVVLTTPEMLCTDDFTELTAVEWDAVVIDEAHRLKSHTSKLAINLRDRRFIFRHTLLLTGTPIQNNMTELWSLLNIIDPGKFGNLDKFMEVYGNITSKEGIDQLHSNIRPYILRRLKEDVEKSVPPKEETLIEVELTSVQKQYYRALYEKNVQFLYRNKRKALDGPSLSNLAMQLRKCCNHVFLLNGVESEVRENEKRTGSMGTEADFLVKFSGKLVLLDKLLPRLKSNGHKVLIFSQFKIMLDIIEDYLHLRNFKSERIDGSITGKKRQMAIDRFQSPDVAGKEPPFIMMLSTRAGGVGINLTAADTCIIFDSDWNPQNDLQAQARCHRIGQKKSVKVYRLLTRKTYEMQMFHLSSMKMGLDQAVLHGFENSNNDSEGSLTKDEIEKLLRHGAYDIFHEEKAGTGDAESTAFVEQDIDSILERRSKKLVHENSGSKSNVAGGTFSKASFKAKGTTDPTDGENSINHIDVDIDDPDFWSKMIGVAKAEENVIEHGKKRSRRMTNYSESQYGKSIDQTIGDLASDQSQSDEARDDDFDENEISDSSTSNSPRKKLKIESTNWGRKNAEGWTRVDVEKVVKGLLSYGYANITWENFRKKTDLIGYSVSELIQMSWAVILVTLLEVAEESVFAIQRKSDRASQRKIDDIKTDGSKHRIDSTHGGVLAMDPKTFLDNGKAMQQLEHQFQLLVNSYRSSLNPVYRDAKLFGISHQRRSRDTVNHVFPQQSNNLSSTPKSVFDQNLWPLLMNRGWKADQGVRGGENSTRYIFGSAMYKSVQSVLDILPSIYPELIATVQHVQSTISSQEKLDNEESLLQLTQLDRGIISANSLQDFLRKFAPLQLLVDRVTARRIGLGKKILLSCNIMYNAHDVMRQAQLSQSEMSVTQHIAKSINLDRRILPPHPLWSSSHDAVLIQAIAKHGWIEFDSCCRSIVEDSSIIWGPPFDGEARDCELSSDIHVDPERLAKVALRAANFLTTERDVLNIVKDFKEEILVKTYSIVKKIVNEERFLTSWEVDISCMHTKSHDRDKNVVDLPTKKDLLKRAKMILVNPIKLLTEETIAPSEANQNIKHDFCTIDQKNVCNTLLVEILRSILHVSFNSSGKRRQIGRRLLNSAISEAKSRIKDLEQEPESDVESISGMGKIIDHCVLVNKYAQALPIQAKNVLRAILSLPLLTPKTGTGLFPPETVARHPGNHNLGDDTLLKLKKMRSKKLRDHGASGDVAISDAMSNIYDESQRNSLLSEGKHLQLTATEVLLLTVVCSQGLPIWTDNWPDLIDPSNIQPENQGPGFINAISWWGMGQVFEAAAIAWHHAAARKLEIQQKSLADQRGTFPENDLSNKSLTVKLDVLRQDVVRKRLALSVAGDYRRNPEKLAKKCIMLLESLRSHMGLVESLTGKNHSRIMKLNSTENGLGPFVLEWLSDEIRRWASSLAVTDDRGQPFSFIAADFNLSRNDKEDFELAALMDSRSCRSVFSQIAQLSRVRSVFLKNTQQDLRSLLFIAVQDFSPAVAWDNAPDWWGDSSSTGPYSIEHDLIILDSLLEYGYSGIEDTFSELQLNVNRKQQGDEVTLTRAELQVRANQLTCALHLVDRSQQAILAVGKRHGIHPTSLPINTPELQILDVSPPIRDRQPQFVTENLQRIAEPIPGDNANEFKGNNINSVTVTALNVDSDATKTLAADTSASASSDVVTILSRSTGNTVSLNCDEKIIEITDLTEMD